MTRRALGRGLGALIPQKITEAQPHATATLPGGLLQLDVEKIVPSPHQPRKEFADDKLQELAASISARGLIQPVIVRPISDGRFELIAGERRWRAAGLAGLLKIPAVVRNAESAEAMELALIENIQRENLNPIETARAYQNIADTFDYSHEEIAARVGKERSSVTNLLRLLNLPDEIQGDVASGALSMGHARALLGIAGREAQLAARAAVLTKGLSVRETELLVKRLIKPRKKKQGVGNENNIYIKELENSLRNAVGTKVTIRHQGKSGVIELHYFSVEELDRLVNHLRQ
jgi:ParB family transcriptional regulator, chromosome partitioning protein